MRKKLSSIKVTLSDDPEPEEKTNTPLVKYNLQIGDLTLKAELSAASNKTKLGDVVR